MDAHESCHGGVGLQVIGVFSASDAFCFRKLNILNDAGRNDAVNSDNQGNGLWSSASLFHFGR